MTRSKILDIDHLLSFNLKKSIIHYYNLINKIKFTLNVNSREVITSLESLFREELSIYIHFLCLNLGKLSFYLRQER